MAIFSGFLQINVCFGLFGRVGQVAPWVGSYTGTTARHISILRLIYIIPVCKVRDTKLSHGSLPRV
jgi:hypothetical protein